MHWQYVFKYNNISLHATIMDSTNVIKPNCISRYLPIQSNIWMTRFVHHIFTPISTKLLADIKYTGILKRKLFVNYLFLFFSSILHNTCFSLFNSCRLNKTQGEKNVDISVGRSMQWLIDVPPYTCRSCQIIRNIGTKRYCFF